jgi:hypothetical protein
MQKQESRVRARPQATVPRLEESQPQIARRSIDRTGKCDELCCKSKARIVGPQC